MRIRPATAADIPAMIELERQCPTAAHWTEQQYREALRASEGALNPRLVLVIDEVNQDAGTARELGGDARPVLRGFLVGRNLGAEWELENIVVAASVRRKGLGMRLLSEFLAWARESRGAEVFLEVRESNHSARALYRKWDFEETGRRKGYYANPPEDALVYRRRLS